jgi:2-dehydro-3-deoxyphosphogluconate aldolase/(4S)-4-hydroxy-2-oxoglutarate aldolase
LYEEFLMDKALTLQKIKTLGLLAVIRGPSRDLTIQMVEALVAGGVTGIEITYSTPQAAQVVHELHEHYGSGITLGMGTLTRPEQAQEAQEAGASFLVSPHCEVELAQAMTDSGLAVMMGALTPTEVVRAHHLGSDVVKLFPGSLGGPAYLKALRGPFPDIPLMPTGGVSEANLRDWFAAGAFAVGAGSNLCPKELAAQGRFTEITEIARKFALAVQAARTS